MKKLEVGGSQGVKEVRRTIFMKLRQLTVISASGTVTRELKQDVHVW